jgi:hypothetical protein
MRFIDAWDFDVRSIKKSCVHIVHKDGRIIPFETMNLFYRDEKEQRLKELQNNTQSPDMRKPLIYFLIAMLVSLLGGMAFSFGAVNIYDLLTLSGALNLILAILFFLAALLRFYCATKSKAKTLLITSGLLLLAGGITCFCIPFKLNH